MVDSCFIYKFAGIFRISKSANQRGLARQRRRGREKNEEKGEDRTEAEEKEETEDRTEAEEREETEDRTEAEKREKENQGAGTRRRGKGQRGFACAGNVEKNSQAYDAKNKEVFTRLYSVFKDKKGVLRYFCADLVL